MRISAQQSVAWLSVSVFAGVAGVSRAAEPAAPKVRVARAAEREVPVTVTLVGTVVPKLRSILGSEIEGLVSG